MGVTKVNTQGQKFIQNWKIRFTKTFLDDGYFKRILHHKITEEALNGRSID